MIRGVRRTGLMLAIALAAGSCRGASGGRGRPELAHVRDVLEVRVHGMSGEGAVIKVVASPSELEAESLANLGTSGRCPRVPFGCAHAEWLSFKRGVRPGDTLVFFRNDKAHWLGLSGAEGYAHIRDGRLIGMFLTSVS